MQGKRRTGIRRIIAIGAALVLATAGLTITPAAPAQASVHATHNAVHGKRFVIDPGHGSACADGQTGTTGPWTLQTERDQVWEVAHAAKNYLENLGAIVYFTKNSAAECPSVADRRAFVDSINPNAFVSIHRNGSPNASTRGIVTYFGHSNLAIYVQGAVVAEWGWPDLGYTTSCVMVSLPCATTASIPSALVEIGYMSNYYEDTGHGTYADWQRSGLGVANGIVNFCFYNGCG